MRRCTCASLCISSSLRYSFREVVQRAATSIVLLTILLAGLITPTGFCALMCERQSRAESQRHCVQSSDTMAGMVHHHSALNHPAVHTMRLALGSQSCLSNCVTADALPASS